MTVSEISQKVTSDSYAPSLSNYERYHITSIPTEPRKKLPHPFWPSVSKIGLVSFLTKETLHLNLKLLQSKYRKVLFQRPCIYGVFDRPVGGLMPIREKCVGCMRCAQEVPGVCKVERNPQFYAFGDSYWIPDDMKLVSSTPLSLVNFEASTGSILVKGMGYKGSFGSKYWDSMWTDMSEIVRPTRDGVYGREFISMAVDFGRKETFIDFSKSDLTISQTISSSIPIIFDYLPANLSSKFILDSISNSAVKARTFFTVHYNSISSLSIEAFDHAIVLIDSPIDLSETSTIENAPLIELTYDMIDLYIEIRKLRPSKPIALRLKLVDNYKDIINNVVDLGFDVLHIEADYHGMTYESNPQFIKEAIRDIHQFLVKENLRDKISIITSGGIILAEHVPKAIICGSDAVAINTSALIALQCEFEGELKTPEQSIIKQEAFDSNWGTRRLTNLLASWYNQSIEILSAMGMRDVRRLRGDTGRAIFKEDIEDEAFIDLEVI